MENSVVNIADIHVLLTELGIEENTVEHELYTYAIELVMQDPDRLNHTVKGVYKVLSDRFQRDMSSIERKMRETAGAVYDGNKKLLKRLAGCELLGKPTVSEFLKIIMEFLEKTL